MNFSIVTENAPESTLNSMAEMNLKIKNALELAFPDYYFTPSPLPITKYTVPPNLLVKKKKREIMFFRAAHVSGCL